MKRHKKRFMDFTTGVPLLSTLDMATGRTNTTSSLVFEYLRQP